MNDYLAWHLTADPEYAAKWHAGVCTCWLCACGFGSEGWTDLDCPLHGKPDVPMRPAIQAIYDRWVSERDLTDGQDCGKVSP